MALTSLGPWKFVRYEPGQKANIDDLGKSF